ncbi:transporter substrate-binding domain-containing protein [Simiduia sp. 21SJ11W-1]|uniref:substrate-binding periplasmic protein n=1 Tax=Simiduia sp. 21SJ11W-1 TaxID=2909669 RepID=UPI0020A03E5D|nr:transporter substrate-binding domain-containing protein [Simiduia sp. 21SJ11W-1]UTA48780.1 transporter substrate-binding domain-containing protein [Simiduia sp. 21SJ11W-1]
MRRLSLLLLALLGPLTWAQAPSPAAGKNVAKLCIDDYPPLTYFVDGKATGAMIDTMNIIGQRLNITIEPTPNTPFARCLRMAEAGLADFMVSLVPTPERLEYLVMFPYADIEPLRFLTLKQFAHKYNDLKTIKLSRLGLVNGFLYPDEFHAETLSVLLAPTAEAGIRLLHSRRVDILLLNETIAVHLVKRDALKVQLRNQQVVMLPLTYERGGNANSIAISKKSKFIGLQDALAEVVEELKNDGTIDRLIEKYQARP